MYADNDGTTPSARMEDEARKTGHGDTRFNFKHKKSLSSTGRSGFDNSANTSEVGKSAKGPPKRVRVNLDDELVKVSAQGDRHGEDN